MPGQEVPSRGVGARDGLRPSPSPRLTQPGSTGEADDVARARAGLSTTALLDTAPSSTAAPGPGAGDRWRGFVRRHGWRAYALPLLVVLTVAALMRSGSDGGASPVAGPGGPSTSRPAPTAAAHTTLQADPGAGGANSTVLAAAALPAGPSYDTSGADTFRVLPGTSKVAGSSGQLWRYSIDVENGLTGIDLTQFQQLVVQTLADPRSWSGHGVRLQRVDSGQIDFHITLTTSLTVRKYCGYDIQAESSCYQRAGTLPGGVVLNDNRVFLNDARWVRGAAAYVGDLAQYRLYMINHEDGHALGHNHAHQCLPGGAAPAMMQQSFGLRSTATGRFCTANPWPYPPGVAIGPTGAPGAEQLDTAANDEYGRGD